MMIWIRLVVFQFLGVSGRTRRLAVGVGISAWGSRCLFVTKKRLGRCSPNLADGRKLGAGRCDIETVRLDPVCCYAPRTTR